jgi:8-oxo-dGTP pyrophosphatase MutT (NUDIX family)
MHRKDLLDQLEAYCLHWPAEEAVVTRFTEFIETHPDCFERSLKVGHITGSAWIVNKPGTHVLLTHHRKLDAWLQLGGHADGNHNIREVALQEAREESGLDEFRMVLDGIFDIDAHLIPERKGEHAHIHYDIRYAFETCHLSDYTVSDESHDLAWVELARLEEYTTEESMRRMARKWENV